MMMMMMIIIIIIITNSGILSRKSRLSADKTAAGENVSKSFAKV